MELATARSFLFAPGNEERKLRKAFTAGADAVILGKALYEGRITLEQALAT